MTNEYCQVLPCWGVAPVFAGSLAGVPAGRKSFAPTTLTAIPTLRHLISLYEKYDAAKEALNKALEFIL